MIAAEMVPAHWPKGDGFANRFAAPGCAAWIDGGDRKMQQAMARMELNTGNLAHPGRCQLGAHSGSAAAVSGSEEAATHGTRCPGRQVSHRASIPGDHGLGRE
jgi:hypothetical protein